MPPGRLLGENIVTIRLHLLSYAVDAKEVEADRTADSPPQFVADTLLRRLRLSCSTRRLGGQSAAPLDPPIFNCRVETDPSQHNYYPESNDKEVLRIGPEHIEHGCKMPGSNFWMTRRIRAGILVEHLVQCDEVGRETVLETYLGDGAAQRPPAWDSRATVAWCALA